MTPNLDERPTLKALIARGDLDSYRDYERVGALLSDYYPGSRKRVAALVACCRGPVVERIDASRASGLTRLETRRMAASVSDAWGIAEYLSDWAVRAWCEALEVDVRSRSDRRWIDDPWQEGPSSSALGRGARSAGNAHRVRRWLVPATIAVLAAAWAHTNPDEARGILSRLAWDTVVGAIALYLAWNLAAILRALVSERSGSTQR